MNQPSRRQPVHRRAVGGASSPTAPALIYPGFFRELGRYGAHAGRVEHTSRCFSPLYCETSAGFYEQALAAHHAMPVRVAEVACQCSGDASCVFELQWM